MKAYGITQEELDQDKSDMQLRHVLEAWDELSEWNKHRILWTVQWAAFCNRLKLPSALKEIGNDFFGLLLKL